LSVDPALTWDEISKDRDSFQEWMAEHVREAHGVKSSKMVDTWISVMPKRREYFNVRDV